MSDWIKSLKKQDEEFERQEHGINELRLHKAKIIRAKTPALWSAVLTQIEEDLAALKEEYPQNIDRHGALTRNKKVAVLENKSLPLRTLELTLDLDGQFVQVSEAHTKSHIKRGVLKPTDPIKITVDHHEEVTFSWQTFKEIGPTVLAEKLIKHVLDVW